MANGYIGKISALVTASTADLSRKLQGSSKDVDRFAKSVSSQIFAASRNAQNSLNSIFTPLQKLERALKAAGGQLNLLKPGQAAEIRAFVSAAEGINKPLEAAQRQFVGLSAEVAGRFIPALNRAQEAALQVNEQISRTGVVTANNFREAQRAVEAFTQSQARLSQIDRAAAGGRSGREAEFVSPRALQTLREAAALSERASQLSPAALQDGGVARQVQRLQTFRNAIARTVAEVEEIRLRPQVDTAALAAAERRLDNIVETTRQAQQELEQIVNGVGQSTDVRARLQSQFAVRQAVEEEAAFRQRAADAAERELAAVERLSQAQNRLLAAEIDRRSGAAARRNASSFDAATGGLLQDRPSRPGVFEQQTRTLESELQRTAQLRQQFLALPAAAQQSLESERQALNNIGTAARDGAASLGLLVEANDRVAASIERVNRREGESTDVRARLQSQFAVRQAVEEEAAFRQRAADAAERELAAVERLSQAQNRLLAAEIDRRSGAAARRNAAAFDAGTEGLLRPDDRPRREFGIAQRTRESELARAAALEQQFLALPEADRNALEGQRRGVQAFISSVESGGTSVAVFTSALDNLEQGMSDVEARAARIRDASSLLVIDEETTRRNDEINRNIDARTPLGDRLAEQGRRRVRGLTGDINIDSTPRGPDGFSAQAQRDIDALGTRVGAVRQQLETLPNAIRVQFIPALQQAKAQLDQLQNSPKATVAEIDAAARSVRSLEESAARAAAAFKLPSFREFANQFSVNQAVGELNALQQVLASIGAEAGGPAAQAYDRYRAKLQQAIRAGTTGLPAVREELVRLQVEAAKAAAATGRISFNRAFRAIKRGGDVARGSLGNLNLAVQQGVFAIDDFISVTGDLGQRLRAAGNNISQLAFLIGGTWGLALGVAINVLAQVAVGVARWASGTEEAEKRQKQLEAAINQVNSALERQRQLTESIAEAYRRLGESIADSGLSEGGQRQRGRDRQIEEIQREQRERRREIAVSVNPVLSGQRARANEIEEQLETETNPLRRRDLTAELRRVRQRIEGDLRLIELGAQVQIDQAEREANRSGGTAIGNLTDRRAGIQSRLETQFRIRDQLVGEGRPTNRVDNQIERLSEALSQLEVAIETLRDSAGIDAIRTAQRAGDVLARTQAEAQDIRGFPRVAAGADEIDREIESVFSRLAEGAIDTASAQRLVSEFLELAEAVNRTAIVAGRFSDALERGAGDLARIVESELGSAAESLRRRANEAQARQPGSDQSNVLRNAQERIEAARRDAQDSRRDIEARIVLRRGELERLFESGLGDEQQQRLARLIQAAQAQVADESLNPSVRDAAQIRLEQLRAELDSLFEGDSQIQGLRDRADQADIQAQREQQQVEQAIRGRELSLTPGQRAAEELASGLEDIRQFYGQLAEATTGLVDFEAQAEAQQRFINQSLRSAAPAIFGLADQVANAVLQGPSRAALQATDVSTVEGSRELNRLLRGDDGARDQNLVELQRQSTILEDMLTEIRQGGADVAN